MYALVHVQKYSIIMYSTIASGHRVDEESEEMRALSTEAASVVHSHTII